jgi:hypothetical protein
LTPVLIVAGHYIQCFTESSSSHCTLGTRTSQSSSISHILCFYLFKFNFVPLFSFYIYITLVKLSQL